MAAGGWLDAGSATGKTVLALGGVFLIVAAVAGAFLLVFGWIQCRMVAGRRTVNRRAVRGLELVLAGWVVFYIGAGLSFTTVYRLWFWPALGVSAVILAVGAGFGIVGIREMRRETRRFNYGRGHAMAAIIAGCAPLLLMVLLAGVALNVYGFDLSVLRMMARGQHRSPEFGYQVQLEGRLWKSWPRMAEKMPGADFGVVSLFEDCGLFVVPVSLGEREVDFGAVVEAMLAETGLAPGSAKLETVTPPAGAHPEERHFRLFRQQEGGGVFYRFRIAVVGGVAYLVCGWIDQRQGVSNDRLDEDVMRVALDGAGAGMAPVAGGPAASVSRHARTYRRIASFLEKHGSRERATEWLAAAGQLDGGAGAVGLASGGIGKALFLLDAGCVAEALPLAETALAGDPGSLTAIATKAVALGRLGRVREGFKALDGVPKAAADHSAVAAAGAYLRMIERGSKAPVIGEPVEAVPLSGAVLQAPAQETASTGAGLAGDWAATAMLFRKGEPLVATRFCRVRVLSEEGARALTAVEETFEPARESVYVNRLVVLDDKGKAAERQVDPADWRRDPAGKGGRARLWVPLPGLRPGMAVEWVVTVRRFLPALHFPYVEHCFSRQWPVRRSVLWLDGDFQAVSASNTPGVPQPQRQPRPHWVVDNPAVKAVGEKWLPADAAYLPIVWVCESGTSWPDLAAAYLDAVRPRMAAAEGIRELARAAAGGADGLEAKVSALTRWVQGYLSDAPGGFCTGERVPAAMGGIAKTREADAKGLASFLQAVLKMEGIDSSLALVAAGGFAQPGLPSLDQFNHMVVFVPGLLPHQFVDCTARDIDPARGLPAAIAARKALVLDPKAPRLVDLSTRLAVGEVEVERIARVRADGGIDLRESARLTGPAKTVARGWFADGGRFGAEAFLRERQGIQGVKASFADERDSAKPAVVEISGAAGPREGGARAASMVEALLMDLSGAEGRKAPAWLDTPLRVRGKLDAGGALAKPASVEGKLVSCKFEEGGGFEYTITRAPGLIASDAFLGLAADSKRVIEAIEPALKPGEEVPRVAPR